MPTTPGQLAAAMRERNTPAADLIEDEAEAHMLALSRVETNGSFEFKTQHGKAMNPAVLAILNERYGRPDHTGWTVAFHDPDLIEFAPQKPIPLAHHGR